MRRRAKAADSQALAFQLLDPGNRRLGDDRIIVSRFGRSDQNDVVALQAGLHHGADIDDRRIAGNQRLRRHLAAAKEYHFGIEAVAAKDAGILGDPNMNLIVGDRRIADLDLPQFLALDIGAGKQL